MKRTIVVCALACVAAGCSSSGGGSSVSAGSGGFALQTGAARAGGETSVALRTQPEAAGVVTLVGNLRYDRDRLQVADCVLSDAARTAGGGAKTLNWGEPSAGLVAAVVSGGLEALPADAEVFSCRFGVKDGAAGSAAAVRAEGEVSDAQLVERSFAVEARVAID